MLTRKKNSILLFGTQMTVQSR